MPWKPAARILGAALVLGLALAALGVLAREPVTNASEAFVGHFGLGGVAFMVWVIDSFFIQNEPALFVGYTGGLGFVPVWLTASAASVLAGATGWSMGRWVGPRGPMLWLIERTGARSLLAEYGGWAIAVAAVGPFPYAPTTWAAGAAGVPFIEVVIGCLFRVPKIAFLLGVIALGWNVGVA